MDYISRQEINVIIVELNSSVFDALSSKLIQFSVFDPLYTLGNGRLVQIQLQFLNEMRKVTCVEGHYIFGDAILVIRFATLNRLQNT